MIVLEIIPNGQFPAETSKVTSKTPTSVNWTEGFWEEKVVPPIKFVKLSELIFCVNETTSQLKPTAWQPSSLNWERSLNVTTSLGQIWVTSLLLESKKLKFAWGFWSIERLNESVDEDSQSEFTEIVTV